MFKKYSNEQFFKDMLIFFGHSSLEHSRLSFDFAQDGEHVEPFRISSFEIRI